MAGDSYNIRVSSWYKSNGASPDAPVNPLTDLLSAITGSVGAITSNHGGVTATELLNNNVFTPGVTEFLNTPASVGPVHGIGGSDIMYLQE